MKLWGNLACCVLQRACSPLCDALECSSPAGKKQHVTAAAIACWQPPAVKGKDTRIITTRWHQLSIYTSPTTSSIKQPQQPCPLLLLQLNTSFFSCYIQFLMFCILLSVHSDNSAGVALESMRGKSKGRRRRRCSTVVVCVCECKCLLSLQQLQLSVGSCS